MSKKSGRPAVVDQARQRVWIERVSPEIDCGRFPVKRVIGEPVVVEVDLFADGHEEVAGVLFVWHELESTERAEVLRPLGNDRYRASFTPERLGRHLFRIAGYVDELAGFRKGLAKKVDAGLDVAVEIEIGRRLVARLHERCKGEDKDAAAAVLETLSRSSADRVAVLLDPTLGALAERHPDLERASWLDRPRAVVVDPPIARCSAWYEMFPRSCGPHGKHGTFADAERLLPYVAELGFDVLYLPPIHPIGTAHRKGKNNTLTAAPDDVGSPWAIGNEDGGHTAIHRELGTVDDFRRFVAAARAHRLEIALDIAFQASPDHPWVKSHPEWFVKRPDGTIQYAENPPKKYQDIYPLDFESVDAMGLWLELRSVFEYWIDLGVKIFRVDNPHTKAFAFWEWCIGELKREHPELVFLAEAFTKPKVMYALAKLGFSQSYTYFTWRYTPHDFVEYLTELTQTEAKEFFRPNFWPNTPDILPPHLTEGGRGAFSARLVLAATLSSSYGIYGPAFELMERTPRPGAEEYLDNEKYELKRWDLDREDSLRYLIARVNRIRREHPALHSNDSLAFHPADDPFLCYSKRAGDDVLLMVVSFDPFAKRSGFVNLDLDALGLGSELELRDLVGGASFRWSGARNYVELDPHAMPAHVFSVKKVP